jgi:hypothetical protein
MPLTHSSAFREKANKATAIAPPTAATAVRRRFNKALRRKAAIFIKKHLLEVESGMNWN